VIAIIPTADRQKSTVKVRVGFDKLDPRILPEMSVKVAFHDAPATTPAAQRSVTLPKSALQQVQGRDVVLVVSNGRTERRPVTVHTAINDEISITAGVAAGERVIVDAPPGVTDGTAVREMTP
jgi:hypothetical protein